MSQKSKTRLLFFSFLCVFIYAIVTMFFVREVLVPSFYNNSVDGNIPGDAQYYSDLAKQKATEIKKDGFASFELRPSGHGVVGVSAALFYGINSQCIIVLLNALVHALSFLLMVKILNYWFTTNISIIAALPLALSPYMIVWFSQINKDSFSLLGVLLFVYGLIAVTKSEHRHNLILQAPLKKELMKNLGISVAGVLIIWTIRPYMNMMLLPGILLALILTVILHLSRITKRQNILSVILFYTCLLVCLNYFSHGAASGETIDSFKTTTSIPDDSNECFASIDVGRWQNETLLTSYINNKFKAIAGQRCLTFTSLELQSNETTLYSIVDSHVYFKGSLDVIKYIPRAAVLGIFSPLPDRWLYSLNQKVSFFYIVTPIEALVMYCGLLCLVFYILRFKEWTLILPIALAFMMMTIYGASNPFIGTIYRYRYPWWMILICLGLAALLAIYCKFKIRDHLPKYRNVV